jgi:pilus assembly protein CpaE
VVVAAEPDPEFLLHAMRAGIRDIVAPNSDAAQLRVLLERASQSFTHRYRAAVPQQAPETTKGLVIGVFSPKGGVGKTTVATNIAIGLGKVAPMSVVIVDLDLQFGDVASGLYLNPEHTVTDAVTPAASQDSLVLKAFLTVHPGSIYALCAPPTPVDADEITPEQISRLLEQLSEQFQYVVVDTAPGLPEIGLAAMEKCTDVVWVSGMDIPSVRGLRAGLDILRQLDVLPETRHVVLNMADAKNGLTVQDLESTIGAPVDVSIPRSRAVSLSTNRGIPILQEPVRDPATKSLNQLVERFNPAWRAKSQRKLHRRVVV